jgi:PAS domain S-box-containing protein
LRERWPQLALDEQPDDEACLRRVSMGEADAAIVDLASASFIISTTGLQGLTVQQNVGFTYHLAMATSSQALRDELERRLGQVDPRDVERLRDQWVRLAAEPHAGALWATLGIVTSVTITVVFLGWGANRALRATVARRTRELAAGEARFRALIERSSDLTLVLDREGRVLFSSPASMALLGSAAPSLEGQSLRERVHPDDVTSFEALCSGTPSPEIRVRRADGTWAHLELHARDLFDEPGVSGLVINGRDVSERNRFREQWLEAQKLESVGRLAGGVAHDFNNLLTVILACGEELREASIKGTPPSPEVIDDLLSTSSRATELTAQLLAFARKQITRPEVLDLNAVMLRHEKLLRRVLSEDVSLITTLQAQGTWPIRADAGLCSQLVMNLAINARDAMPNGGALRFETANVTFEPGTPLPERDMRPGDYVRLRVQDSGTGMSEQVLAHLFEPFFTTKPQGRGTGLGLATVHGIVKQSGASVAVESVVGRGTTFDVYFPRVSPEPLSVVKTEQPTLPRAKCVETVLAVEDDARVREVTERALLADGYRVLSAGEPTEALRIAEAEAGPIHLLLSDVVMPNGGGLELARRLRLLRPELRVLFVSGYSDDVVSRHGVLADGAQLLPKPFTPETLRQRVREVLDAQLAPQRSSG